MTGISIPQPIPAGAVAGDWHDAGGCGHLEDTWRCLTWSRHDAAGVEVAIGGTQYGDGRLHRHVMVRP